MMSSSPFSRFEKFARQLVEGSFDRLLGQQPGPLTEVAGSLAAAAEKTQQNDLTANLYVVRLNPATLTVIQQQSPDYVSLLEQALVRLGEQNGLVYAGNVQVEFASDPSMAEGEFMVEPDLSEVQDEPTAVLQRKRSATAPLKMAEAYLILNGRRHVMLDKPVNSIGRALENDIILEDQGVSRIHAQIRWRNGGFEIFDLGSKAGTLVNGRRLARGPLKSGDVITLGSAAVIYGEEDSQGSESKKARVDITQELSVDDVL